MFPRIARDQMHWTHPYGLPHVTMPGMCRIDHSHVLQEVLSGSVYVALGFTSISICVKCFTMHFASCVKVCKQAKHHAVM